MRGLVFNTFYVLPNTIGGKGTVFWWNCRIVGLLIVKFVTRFWVVYLEQ